MRYDDPGPGGIGSAGAWIGAFQPELKLERLAPVASWNILAHRRFDSSEQSRRPRVSNDVAIGTVTSQFAEHSQVTVEGRYFRSRDLIHPDPESPLASTETQYASGSARASFWRGDASYQARARSYSSPALGDADSRSWGATIHPFRSEQQTWSVAWRHDDWRLSGDADLSASVGTLGYRRQHTEQVSSALEVGMVEVEDGVPGSRRRDLALAASLDGLGHMLRLPFDARLRVTRDVSTAGVAEAWSSLGGAQLTVRWERALEAEGGIFHEPTRRDYVSAEARDTVSAGTILSLEGSYRRARPRSVSTAQIETYRASACFLRQANNWLTGAVRYSLARQVGTGGTDLPDVDRSRVELTLTAAYR
jgi:hypothetical protein